MSNSNEQVLAQFMDMTQCDESKAKFFLEASNYDIESAAAAFFNNDDQNGNDDSDVAMKTYHQSSESGSSNINSDNINPFDNNSSSGSRSSSKNNKENTAKRTTRSKGFASLDDYKNDSCDSDDDHPKGQDYFAGGSERSGQMITGPPDRDGRGGMGDLMSGIVEKSKVYMQDKGKGKGDLHASSRSKSMFKGSGNKLGDSVSSETKSDVTRKSKQNESESENDDDSDVQKVELRFYSDGFMIGDGPFRGLADPANASFLSSILTGQIPSELRALQTNRDKPLDVQIIDKRNEKYDESKESKMSKKPRNAFQGTGNVLGVPTPTIVANSTPNKSTSHSHSPQLSESSQASGLELTVDSSKPVTSLQVRLGDGSLLVLKANHHHTVGQIREVIRLSRPKAPAFTLRSGFPPKQLSEDTISLQEAKLLNAVIIQKYN